MVVVVVVVVVGSLLVEGGMVACVNKLAAAEALQRKGLVNGSLAGGEGAELFKWIAVNLHLVRAFPVGQCVRRGCGCQ